MSIQLPSQTPGSVAVTFVSGSAGLGGAERYLETLLQELDRPWINGAILLADGPFLRQLQTMSIPVDVVRAPGRLGVFKAALSLRRVLRAQQPDVIHANGLKAALMCSLAGAGLRVPVLWLKVDQARDGAIAWIVAAGCRRVVGISNATLATFPRLLRPRTAVVYAGIRIGGIDRAASRELVLAITGLQPDAEVVVISGRVSPGKGQLELIEAAPRILASRPGTRFVILGGEDPFFPGFETTLRDRAQTLEVIDAFSFLGHRPAGVTSAEAAAGFVAGCQVLAAPSVRQRLGGWQEGFGLAAVEALHAGTPVVAYDSGALPEVLGDCARIVAEGDRLALADAIVQTMDGGEAQVMMSQRGLRRAEELFSIERAALEMCRHYVELAGR